MSLLENVYAQFISPDPVDPMEKSGISNLSGVFGTFLNVLLGAGWGIVFITAALGVIKYIDSKGEPKETHSAQQSLLMTVIGGLIMIFITTLRIIMDRLIGARWGGVPGVTNFIR